MRFLAFFAIVASAGSAAAQLPSWDSVVATAKSVWKKTVDAGRPLAMRIARETPERFRLAKKQAFDLVKRAQKYAAGMDLDQKRALAVELWRVRGSLDLMALLDPQTLKMFGIDVPDLNKLRNDVARSIQQLRS